MKDKEVSTEVDSLVTLILGLVTLILGLDTFFFFVPYRLVWSNFKAFMGEQKTPGAPTDFLVPQCLSPAGGWPIGSLGDYFGLPTVGQVAAGKQISHSALPMRAYEKSKTA